MSKKISDFEVKETIKKLKSIESCASFEKNMELKLDVGSGGTSIMRTNDNGFIISTIGGTIIKTDSNLSYE